MSVNWWEVYGRNTPNVKRQGSTTETLSTSSSSSSSTSSSSTSSSSTSSTSATSTTSSSETTPTSTTSSTPSSTEETTSLPTSLTRSTRSNGEIVTITQTVPPRPSQTTPAQGTNFWQNKAAVGATFGIVGVAGLILAFFLITTFIRKRRAKRFDRDVEKAAAAAAASADAASYPFDDDDGTWGPGSRTRNGYGSYPKMEEDPYAYSAAAGVIGVGAYPTQQQHLGHDSYNLHTMGDNRPSAYAGSNNYPGPYGSPVHMHGGGQPNSVGTSIATFPGIAGVGSGNSGPNNYPAPPVAGGMMPHEQPYQAQPVDDPYGGYMSPTATDSRYPNPYLASTSPSPPPPAPVRSPPPPFFDPQPTDPHSGPPRQLVVANE